MGLFGFDAAKLVQFCNHATKNPIFFYLADFQHN